MNDSKVLNSEENEKQKLDVVINFQEFQKRENPYKEDFVLDESSKIKKKKKLNDIVEENDKKKEEVRIEEKFDLYNLERKDEDLKNNYERNNRLNVKDRQKLATIDLRNFHNWIKSVLIIKTTRKLKSQVKNLKLCVLDIGCNKGGDLEKWRIAETCFYVGIDIVANVLKEAFKRWEDSFRNK